MPIKPDRFELIAEDGPVENHRDENHRNSRNKKAEIDVRPGEQVSQPLHLERSRFGDMARFRLITPLEIGRNHVIGDPVRDPVHHDARNDLVHIETRFEQARNDSPDCATGGSDNNRQTEQQRLGQINGQTDDGGRKPAN